MRTLRLQRTSRGAWGVSIAMGAMVWAVAWAAAPAAAEVVYLGETFEVFGPNDANLDLKGNVVGVNADSGSNRTVGTVKFWSQANASAYYGITISGSSAGQGIPEFGSTADDDNFELVFDAGRHSQPQINIPVTPGSTYKIQLLTSEQTHAATPPGRGMDVWIEGQQAVDEMPVYAADGRHQSAFQADSATLYTHTLTAQDSQLTISLLGSSTFPDNNPYFQALTVENLTTTVGTFTGGDPGEGLDLTGDFRYAVDAGGAGGFQIGDAQFTTESVAGVTLTAEYAAATWNNIAEFGSTPADEGLEDLVRSIRWTDTSNGGIDQVSVDLEVEPGQTYQLQLILDEACCPRGFNVFLDGELAVGNLDLLGVEGGGTDPAQGIVVTHTFLALDTVFSIVLDGAGTPFGDDNPILNALTLEKVPEPSAMVLLALGGLGLIGYAGVRRRRGARR